MGQYVEYSGIISNIIRLPLKSLSPLLHAINKLTSRWQSHPEPS